MPEKMTSKDKNRAAILKAALPHVAFDGWTPAVMRRAAQEAGIGHEAMRVAFPGGVNDLIDYFLADGDRRMAETLAGRGLDNMKIREKVTLAARSRIEADADHREALRRAVSYAALPVAGALGPRSLYRTVDAIWRAVGDTSADFNFYTKRAILAAVYSAVTLHWLGDETEDFSSTWAFLDRRIEDVMRIEKAKAGLRGFAEKLPDPVGLMGRLRYPGTRG